MRIQLCYIFNVSKKTATYGAEKEFSNFVYAYILLFIIIMTCVWLFIGNNDSDGGHVHKYSDIIKK